MANPDYEQIFDLAMKAMEKLYEPLNGYDAGFDGSRFNSLEKRKPSFSLGNFYGQA